MTVKLLTEHHLEFLSLIGGCTGSTEYPIVKIPHCWKSHVWAQKMDKPDKVNDNYIQYQKVRKKAKISMSVSTLSTTCWSYSH